MKKNQLMTNSNFDSAYVWIWLPHSNDPIVCGKIEKDKNNHDFFYGESYLNNNKAISLAPNELPLTRSKLFTPQHSLHHVFRDALPDAWGQRILLHQYQTGSLSPLEMLLLSSSDRIGALHFQNQPDKFEPQYENHATLDQLLEATSLVEKGQPLSEELGIALFHGTSVGGARPKALLEDNNKNYIAKFSSTTDVFPIVQAEYAAMLLGSKLGLVTANVKLEKVAGKYILLIERFDRNKFKKQWQRNFMVSALTLLNLDISEARYASYLDLADNIRKYCKNPIEDLHELYKRMVFNILIGNTDDHAKNHSFFWDGNSYSLTPAYDICPYLRAGQQATQAMIVGKNGAYSQLSNALSAAEWFAYTTDEAKNEIDKLVEGVKNHWPEACEQAKLTKLQQNQLTGTSVLNPYCFYDEP